MRLYIVNAAQETVNVERLIYNVRDYVFVLEIVTSDTSVVINSGFEILLLMIKSMFLFHNVNFIFLSSDVNNLQVIFQKLL